MTDTLLNPLKDDVDIAFRLGHHLIEGLVAKPLHKIESVLCASADYLQQHGCPSHPRELVEHQCISFGEHEKDNLWLFERGDEQHSIATTGRYRVNHSQMRLAGVKAHLGIGLFPDFTVQQAIDDGSVLPLLKDWQVRQKYQGEVSMQFAQNKYMPTRLRFFIDYISEALADYSTPKSELAP